MLFDAGSESYTVNWQPLNLTVSFSKAIQSLDEAQVTLSNCRVLSSLRYSNSIYHFILAPLSHGVFSFTVPAGAVTDLHGNANDAATFTRYYAEGFLTTSLTALRPLYADLTLQYTYAATAGCVLVESRNGTLTCDAVLGAEDAITRELQPGTPATVRASAIRLNHTYYAYCCAREANDIEMSNSVQSTEVTIAVGWLDCPVVGGDVCSAHGTCENGARCACEDGFYGDGCEDSCPGLMATASGVKECSGHGVCRQSRYQCR